MLHNQILPMTDGAVRLNDLTLAPYPQFQIVGDALRCSQVVGQLLGSDDPFAMLWRAKIRPHVLELLLRYNPAASSIVLRLAQDQEARFWDWSTFCPMLIDLMVYYITQEADYDQVRLNEAISAVEAGWKSVLRLLDLPDERAFVRLLAKIPLGEFLPLSLHNLTSAYRHRRKRRLLSHLPVLNSEILDTIQLPTEMLSSHLLGLRLPRDCEEVGSIRQLCGRIMRCRQLDGLKPLWPFGGQQPSLQTLLMTCRRLESKCPQARNFGSLQFPFPPLPAVNSAVFKIEPIVSPTELALESMTMKNCADSYISNVVEGTHYLYRLMYPEPATVLLIRCRDGWHPAQVRTAANGMPKQSTVRAICKWAGAEILKDDRDDFPF